MSDEGDQRNPWDPTRRPSPEPRARRRPAGRASRRTASSPTASPVQGQPATAAALRPAARRPARSTASRPTAAALRPAARVRPARRTASSPASLRPGRRRTATAHGGLRLRGYPQTRPTSSKATTVMVLGIVSLVLMFTCGLGFIRGDRRAGDGRWRRAGDRASPAGSSAARARSRPAGSRLDHLGLTALGVLLRHRSCVAVRDRRQRSDTDVLTELRRAVLLLLTCARGPG